MKSVAPGSYTIYTRDMGTCLSVAALATQRHTYLIYNHKKSRLHEETERRGGIMFLMMHAGSTHTHPTGW